MLLLLKIVSLSITFTTISSMNVNVTETTADEMPFKSRKVSGKEAFKKYVKEIDLVEVYFQEYNDHFQRNNSNKSSAKQTISVYNGAATPFRKKKIALKRDRREVDADENNLHRINVPRNVFSFSPGTQFCHSFELPCPEWTEWHGNDTCSVSCGGGRRSLLRYCRHRTLAKQCEGERKKIETCNNHSCPAWSPWTVSSPCSKTCGVGQKILSRTCMQGKENVTGCYGPTQKIVLCNVSLACSLEWSAWSKFSLCSLSCGLNGTQLRTRRCIGASYANDSCIGNFIERRSCNINLQCPRKYSEWSSWSSCNAECGTWTEATRKRKCLLPPCAEEHFSERKLCRSLNCSPLYAARMNASNESNLTNFYQGAWSQWSVCSTSCGESGIQLRSRNCSSREISTNLICKNKDTEKRVCHHFVSCPRWASWLSWSSCLTKCDSPGQRLRIRHCVTRRYGLQTNVETLSGNKLNRRGRNEIVNPQLCNETYESSYQIQVCQNMQCAAQWKQWSSWSMCSSTCGSGIAFSQRICNIAKDNNACRGMSIKYRPCYSAPCWTTWTSYSPCTTSCGNKGVKTRIRQCVGKIYAYLDYERCNGNATETTQCNTQVCPRWSEWSQYSACSITCGGGIKYRIRTCKRGDCKGKRIHTTICNLQSCPYWSEWSAFSCCSVSCGAGVKTRSRFCIDGKRGNQGCQGLTTELVQCEAGACNITQAGLNLSECGIRPQQVVQRDAPGHIRIFGGQIAEAYQWPWQVSLQYYNCMESPCWKHFCGGTLIASQWVLSAGHCTEELGIEYDKDNPSKHLSVVVGMRFMDMLNETDRIRIKRLFLHPRYAYVSVVTNDIELMKLVRPVDTAIMAVPACLPQMQRPSPGELCFVTGWGHTENAEQPSNELREAQIPILDFNQCITLGSYYFFFLIETLHMCAGDPRTAKPDSCEGDSGGPLVCRREDGRWYIAGVTSFAFTLCGTPDHVGIYVPITTYETWIRNTIENYSHGGC